MRVWTRAGPLELVEILASPLELAGIQAALQEQLREQVYSLVWQQEPVWFQAGPLELAEIRAALQAEPPEQVYSRVWQREPVWSRGALLERVGPQVVLLERVGWQAELPEPVVRLGGLQQVARNYLGAYWEAFHEQVLVALCGPQAVLLVLVHRDEPPVPVAQVVPLPLGWTRDGCLEQVVPGCPDACWEGRHDPLRLAVHPLVCPSQVGVDPAGWLELVDPVSLLRLAVQVLKPA